MDSWIKLTPPPRHVTMLSMRFHSIELDTYCYYDYLELYKGGNSSSDRAWRLCGTRVIPERVYDSRVLYLFFHSDSRKEARGFRLIFSYHQVCQSKYVCMRTCLYIYIQVCFLLGSLCGCTCVTVGMCSHACVSVSLSASVPVSMCARASVFQCVCFRECACSLRVCVCVCVCVCVSDIFACIRNFSS